MTTSPNTAEADSIQCLPNEVCGRVWVSDLSVGVDAGSDGGVGVFGCRCACVSVRACPSVRACKSVCV
jgi:hypothetical protein